MGITHEITPVCPTGDMWYSLCARPQSDIKLFYLRKALQVLYKSDLEQYALTISINLWIAPRSAGEISNKKTQLKCIHLQDSAGVLVVLWVGSNNTGSFNSSSTSWKYHVSNQLFDHHIND